MLCQRFESSQQRHIASLKCLRHVNASAGNKQIGSTPKRLQKKMRKNKQKKKKEKTDQVRIRHERNRSGKIHGVKGRSSDALRQIFGENRLALHRAFLESGGAQLLGAKGDIGLVNVEAHNFELFSLDNLRICNQRRARSDAHIEHTRFSGKTRKNLEKKKKKTKTKNKNKQSKTLHTSLYHTDVMRTMTRS